MASLVPTNSNGDTTYNTTAKEEDISSSSDNSGGLTMSPTRLRKKMPVEIGHTRDSNHHPHHGVEMMPLAQTSDDADDNDDNDNVDVDYDLVDRFADEPGSDTEKELPILTGRTTNLPPWLEDFLFPPQLPRKCQLLRPENIAVPACYLLVGLLLGLSSPLYNAYPVDLGATEAQQTSISAIRNLPASFKLIFGFLSDSTPLFGYRRKSYMLLGWCVCSFFYILLMMGSNLSLQLGATGCNSASHLDEAPSIPPEDAPTVKFLSFCALLSGVGLWFADVMGDSIVAEKAKLEPPEQRGSVQSTCYAYRFFGSMISVPLGTYLYSTMGPSAVVSLLALLPLAIVPCVIMFEERKDVPVAPIQEQCAEIYNTVCSRSVWQPLGFVYLYNILQVGNAAWKQFLVTNLGFTACQLNMLLISAYILIYLGVLTYKYCMIHWSWRKVYIVTTLLNGLFSILQVLLIMGITFGLSPFIFAFGDDAFAEFLGGVQFLVCVFVFVYTHCLLLLLVVVGHVLLLVSNSVLPWW